MNISKITIKNYRLLRDTCIDCEEDLSLIIGKNNCGKTSLLSAIAKCIGNKSEVGNFEFYDFNTSFQKKLFNVIEGQEEFKDNELKGIRIDFYINYSDNDNLSNLSQLLLDLDPVNNMIVLRFAYVLKEKSNLTVDFREYKNKRKELTAREAFERFLQKKYKLYFELKKYSILYNYSSKKIDEKVYKVIENKDIDLNKIIAFNYIGAKRNVSNSNEGDLSFLASNYYKKIKNSIENESDSIVQEFEDMVDKTDKQFNEVYSSIFQSVTNKILKFGGINENESVLRVISQIEGLNLLKDNTTVVYKTQTEFLPENYNGLGYLNLFNMIINIEIKLNEFKKETEEETPADINLLFIEEPEAHTHPQMQYIFIKNIKKLLDEGRKTKDNKKINLQTLITTHSSHIVAESRFDDIKYFVKVEDNDGYNAIAKNLKELKTLYQKEEGEKNNHFKFLKQYLTLNRAEIFFADKIILVEGDTERILLPAMMKKLDQENHYNTPLLSQNISVIEVGNYSKIYSEFIQFIDIKTLIITDIDINNNDNKKCRVSEGVSTSNESLKFYLKEKLKEKTELEYKNEKEVLTSLILDEKIISYNNEEEKWKNNKNGKVLIIYQINEENDKEIKYNARSFEDAFFHINRDMFINLKGKNQKEKEEECKSKFQSLKNHKYLFNIKKDSYDLAENCVNRKPSLAMDILLNSENSKDKDYINWKIPAYIKEGLEWLQKD